jgi:hypothetical protein
MVSKRPKFPSAAGGHAAAETTKPAREPDDELAPSESAEAGWRASSYDLKNGLDVVELPTSLPADVLDDDPACSAAARDAAA